MPVCRWEHSTVLFEGSRRGRPLRQRLASRQEAHDERSAGGCRRRCHYGHMAACELTDANTNTWLHAMRYIWPLASLLWWGQTLGREGWPTRIDGARDEPPDSALKLSVILGSRQRRIDGNRLRWQIIAMINIIDSHMYLSACRLSPMMEEQQQQQHHVRAPCHFLLASRNECVCSPLAGWL